MCTVSARYGFRFTTEQKKKLILVQGSHHKRILNKAFVLWRNDNATLFTGNLNRMIFKKVFGGCDLNFNCVTNTVVVKTSITLD